MGHDLRCYPRLRLGRLGLWASLIWAGRRRHAATSHATIRATRRAPAPSLCPGLTSKPSGAAGEDEAQEHAQTRPSAPSLMGPMRGCP